MYGLSPLVKVSYSTRNLISLIWFWNVCIFTICGTMVLTAWLIDRFGSPPKKNADQRTRNHR